MFWNYNLYKRGLISTFTITKIYHEFAKAMTQKYINIPKLLET